MTWTPSVTWTSSDLPPLYQPLIVWLIEYWLIDLNWILIDWSNKNFWKEIWIRLDKKKYEFWVKSRINVILALPHLHQPLSVKQIFLKRNMNQAKHEKIRILSRVQNKRILWRPSQAEVRVDVVENRREAYKIWSTLFEDCFICPTRAKFCFD